MKRQKLSSILKKGLSAITACAVSAGILPSVSVFAENRNSGRLPYAVFANSEEDGAVNIKASNLTVNGDFCTNGTIIKETAEENFNGSIYENTGKDMIYILNKIDSEYFSDGSFEKHIEDYVLNRETIVIETPTEVTGSAALTGTINISTALKALGGVTLNGEVKNTDNSVIYSKYGDVVINSSNVNINGLIYAPFGDVKINSDTLNLNETVIIANNVILESPIVNVNYSADIADFVGNTSEELDIPKDEWEYMKDENENDIPDFFENPDNWNKLKDSDSDGLPDCIEEYLGTNPNKKDTDGDLLNDYYEVFVTFTDPLNDDTDGNGVKDGSEDFDKDALSNWKEYLNKTEPYNPDSDGDGLKDGKEVNTYKTDPLNPDTDGDKLNDGDEINLGTDPLKPDTDENGVADCDEKFRQTLVYNSENEDSAVSQVLISMNGTGYIRSTTSVESIMNKDILCTDAVGLVGEPFEIESTSSFDEATITFKIDQTKLGDTSFDNLMFLWYDEENDNFEELETTLNKTKSYVSVTAGHFSKYMVVDRQAWFDNWREIYNKYEQLPSRPSVTSICVDCSGSMGWNDPSFQIYDHSYTCYRNLAVKGFIDAMFSNDKTGIITFENYASEVCGLTSNKNILNQAASFYNGGGTNANAAITAALNQLENNENGNESIILMSDGDVNVSTENLNLAIQKNIKIHTIGLGSGASNTTLKLYAEQTGGEFFAVTTAAGLEDIYNKLSVNNQFNFDSMSDSDGDGVPDDIEISGIPMSNGLIVYTDPNNSDTDGDGLTDGEEVGQLKRIQGFNLDTPEEAVVYKFYFNIKSDPTKIDTQKSQKLLDYLTEELNKMMPPEYDENGNKINAQNKECSKTWNYFNKYIWIYLPEYTTSPQSKYAAYTAWLRETYGTSGLEKFWTTTDKYAEIFYYEITHITDTIPKSIKQIFYGNYSEEITITGTAGQIVVGFSGIDFVADIRDVTYDIDHWEWSWSHAGQTCLDMIGILPIVGVLKNCDEFAELRRLSNVDSCTELNKSISEIDDLLKSGKTADEIIEIQKKNYAEKISIILKSDISVQVKEYLDKLPQNKISHIINGSENMGHAHNWEKLVPDKNWEEIKTIITTVMVNGIEYPYGTVYMKKMVFNGYDVEVTYNKVNDIFAISDAWIKL